MSIFRYLLNEQLIESSQILSDAVDDNNFDGILYQLMILNDIDFDLINKFYSHDFSFTIDDILKLLIDMNYLCSDDLDLVITLSIYFLTEDLIAKIKNTNSVVYSMIKNAKSQNNIEFEYKSLDDKLICIQLSIKNNYSHMFKYFLDKSDNDDAMQIYKFICRYGTLEMLEQLFELYPDEHKCLEIGYIHSSKGNNDIAKFFVDELGIEYFKEKMKYANCNDNNPFYILGKIKNVELIIYISDKMNDKLHNLMQVAEDNDLFELYEYVFKNNLNRMKDPDFAFVAYFNAVYKNDIKMMDLLIKYKFNLGDSCSDSFDEIFYMLYEHDQYEIFSAIVEYSRREHNGIWNFIETLHLYIDESLMPPYEVYRKQTPEEKKRRDDDIYKDDFAYVRMFARLDYKDEMKIVVNAGRDITDEMRLAVTDYASDEMKVILGF